MLKTIKEWFDTSETIAWSRLQMFGGIIWGVLSVTDLSPVLTGKWMTAWLIVSGIIGEYLRRRGTEVRNGVLRGTDTVDK